MPYNTLEHPDITRTMRTGYPVEPDFGLDCAKCEGEILGRSFLIDGAKVCVECFREYIDDLMITNPEMVAEAMEIETYKEESI